MDWATYRRVLVAIVGKAHAELAVIWAHAEGLAPPATVALLLATLPSIIERWATLATVTAADTYDTARAATVAAGPVFRATHAPPLPLDQAEAYVRWAVGPLFAGEPDPTRALTQLEGGMARLVQLPARDTIITATELDPVRVGYARVPHGDHPCGFCLMLASRGAVYRSESSAEFRQDGRRYHDECFCQPEPLFDGQDLPEVNQRLAGEWRAVTRGTHSPDEARLVWNQHVDEQRARSASVQEEARS